MNAIKTRPADKVRARVPSSAQRASFAYFGGLEFAGLQRKQCQLLLLQDSIHLTDDREIEQTFRGRQWEPLWEGRRAIDRDERFRLYRRVDGPAGEILPTLLPSKATLPAH